MRCPECCSENVKIINTRDVGFRKRRHHCIDCGYRFSTVEVIVNRNDMKTKRELLRFGIDIFNDQRKLITEISEHMELNDNGDLTILKYDQFIKKLIEFKRGLSE